MAGWLIGFRDWPVYISKSANFGQISLAICSKDSQKHRRICELPERQKKTLDSVKGKSNNKLDAKMDRSRPIAGPPGPRAPLPVVPRRILGYRRSADNAGKHASAVCTVAWRAHAGSYGSQAREDTHKLDT